MNIKPLKEKFIEKCNNIVDGKPIDEGGIDDIKYTSLNLLSDIFHMYVTSYCDFFDNKAFKAVTQENVLKIIEKGILEIFKEDINIRTFGEYVFNALLLSSLQFLFDYEINNDKEVKERLQTILTHKNTMDMMGRLCKFKIDSHYSNKYELSSINIPLTHYWWWDRD